MFMKKEYFFMKRRASMPNLQIKGMDEELYEGIKRVAAMENRSMSQQVVHLIKEHLRKRHGAKRSSAEALLALAGSWEDERPAEEIVGEMRGARKSPRPKESF
jgi:hypothetical protein